MRVHPSHPPSTSCSHSLLPRDMSSNFSPSTSPLPSPFSPSSSPSFPLSEPFSFHMPSSFYVLVTTAAFLKAPSEPSCILTPALPPFHLLFPPPPQMPSSFYVLVTTPAFPKGALRAQLEASLFTKLAGCSRGFGC
ncbi:unnamed protein product [Closterium sp. NIES-64]|nr:unnamed protein product [Closterium sp. NIES-64]